MKIGLNEALTGFSRKVKTLDNREIAITLTPGGFVKHQGKKSTLWYTWLIQLKGVKVAAGEGMPIYRNPFEKGNLIVQFEVEYPKPEWFSVQENRDKLEALLPPKQEQGMFENEQLYLLSVVRC